MDERGEEIHIATDEARGASTPNVVRWVLAISLLAAIVLLSVIWMTGAATQGDEESEISVGAMATDSPGQATDSIVGQDADRLETAEPGDDSVTPRIENRAADEPPAN